MIEWVMFFAMGFLSAALLSLPCIAAVHRRAVRLTRRELEATIPSDAELKTSRELLRADFAVSMRRLEMRVERLTAEKAMLMSDLSRKCSAVTRMKMELAEKLATIFALEARAKTVADALDARETDLALKTWLLGAAEHALADRQSTPVPEAVNSQSVEPAASRLQFALANKRRRIRRANGGMKTDAQIASGPQVRARADA